MASFDIFNGDAFSVQSMTQAITDIPRTPTRIGELGLFSESGISTTALSIERQGSSLSLVPAGTRGSPGTTQDRDRRQMIPINTVHLAKRDTVKADEVQNIRAFGSETEVQAVQTLVNRQLGKMKRDIDLTLEYHRVGALKGQVLDADGTTVLLDLFQTFGVTKQTKALVLNNASTKVRMKIIEAKRMIEAALGGIRMTGMRAICSTSFFDALVSHDSVEQAFDRWNSGEFLRSDYSAENGQGGGFPFAGVKWEEYSGSVGGVQFIPDGKAILVPEGVADMFITNYAPADYMETVNTNGVPYYSRQEVLRMNKGVEIEAQSNPICINTRPNGVIELSIS